MKYQESDVAKVIIDYYESLGYTTYKEVTAKGSSGGGSSRADIVAIKGNQHITIETKINFGLSVIKQAFNWKSKSHLVFIGIPRKKRTKVKRFGYDICRDLGIGILEVDMKKNDIIEYQPSSFNDNPSLPKIYESQKDEIAGVSGSYITPFKITKSKIITYLKQSGETSLSKLVTQIEHHYKNDSSAKRSISKLVRIGVIENVKLFKKSNKIYLRYEH